MGAVSDINAQRSVAVAGLKRRANAAWKNYHAATETRLVAQLADHRGSAEATRQALALAQSDERTARSEWLKAARAWQEASRLAEGKAA